MVEHGKTLTGAGGLLLAALVLSLAGCCAGPELLGGRYEQDLALQPRKTFALVAPVLSDGLWGYAVPAASVAPLASAYQVDVAALDSSTAAPLMGSAGLKSGSEAPPLLRSALESAGDALVGLGYVRVKAGETPDFVVGIGITWREASPPKPDEPLPPLATLAIHVGAVVEGRFEPRRATFLIGMPEDDPCPYQVGELTRIVVSALPPHDPEGER